MMKMRVYETITLVVLFLAWSAVARGQMELVPGARYDPQVPTLIEVVGYDFGEEISSSSQIEDYLQALAEAEPERCHLIRYGETWEGRPLYMLMLGSEERMAKKDTIQADLQRFADPRRLTGEEAERLGKVVPSLDGGHVKRGAPLEGQAGQTFLEQVDQQPLVSLVLSEISVVRLQMGNGTAPTIVFIKIWDTEFRWEHRL